MKPSVLVYLAPLLFTVVLAACEKQKPADVPKPTTTAPPISTSPSSAAPAVGNTTDPSIPPTAAAVQTAPGGPTADHKRSGDPQTTMTKQEESSAMPKPSQANDHSTTAVDPKK
ncbi:MAG: hypothetical protein H0U63_06060 [Burkholderiales bacterium]|nr:hypothetical protein [Burkholderiales bacterium]